MSKYIKNFIIDDAALIDGTDLIDNELGIGIYNDKVYLYKLDATSGLDEHIPDIIKPLTNAGDKRWIRLNPDIKIIPEEDSYTFWDGLEWGSDILTPNWQDPEVINNKFIQEQLAEITSVSDVMNALIGNIDESHLYKSLSSKIELIEPLKDDFDNLVTDVKTLTTVQKDDSEALAQKLEVAQANTDFGFSSIQEQITARVDAERTIAESIRNITTTVGTHTTTIQETITSLNGIEGNYSIKINNNGYVSGFGLLSTGGDDTPTSEFMILADKFQIVTPSAGPSETPVVPFIVGEVDGVSTVGVNGQLIVDGSIKANAISTTDLFAINVSVTKAGITATGSADTDTRIWAGDTYANRASAPFRVTQAGKIYANDISISGGSGTYTGVVNMTKQAGCNLTNSTDISLSGVTLVTWDNEEWDTNNNFNTSTNRFTLDEDGKISISSQILFDWGYYYDADELLIHIYVNGSQVRLGGFVSLIDAGTSGEDNVHQGPQIVSISATLDLDAGDYIEIKFSCDNSSGDIKGDSRLNFLSIQKVA